MSAKKQKAAQATTTQATATTAQATTAQATPPPPPATPATQATATQAAQATAPATTNPATAATPYPPVATVEAEVAQVLRRAYDAGVIELDPSQLIEHASNKRLERDMPGQVERLAADMAANGQITPILVHADPSFPASPMRILQGHIRTRAAKLAGIEVKAHVVREHLSEAVIEALVQDYQNAHSQRATVAAMYRLFRIHGAKLWALPASLRLAEEYRRQPLPAAPVEELCKAVWASGKEADAIRAKLTAEGKPVRRESNLRGWLEALTRLPGIIPTRQLLEGDFPLTRIGEIILAGSENGKQFGKNSRLAKYIDAKTGRLNWKAYAAEAADHAAYMYPYFLEWGVLDASTPAPEAPEAEAEDDDAEGEAIEAPENWKPGTVGHAIAMLARHAKVNRDTVFGLALTGEAAEMLAELLAEAEKAEAEKAE